MSPKLHRTLKNLFRVFLILFGNALYSLAIVAFILPSGIITGGTTGLALASACGTSAQMRGGPRPDGTG